MRDAHREMKQVIGVILIFNPDQVIKINAEVIFQEIILVIPNGCILKIEKAPIRQTL